MNEKAPQLEREEKGQSRVRKALTRAAGAFKRNPELARKPQEEEVALESNGEVVEAQKELIEAGYDVYVDAYGPWVDDQAKVLGELALMNPDGEVVRFTKYKFYGPSGSTVRSFIHKSPVLLPAQYQEHIERWQLEVSEEKPSSELFSEPEG